MYIELEQLEELALEAENELLPVYRELDKTSWINHSKVLAAFQEEKVSDFHLKSSSGYGYNDMGREILEKLYARIFGAEAALVRSQIVSGTHAMAICLFGILRPGDELVSATGTPYDTLEEIIGIRGSGGGSLKEFGIAYRQVELLPDGKLDYEKLKEAVSSQTKCIMLQRSRGYSERPALTVAQIGELCSFVKQNWPSIIVFVDNCYGEFVETLEPCDVGADLVAGSLIKNPGGGLAPTGGYIVGRSELVELAANRWTAPGIGAEVGPSPDFQRLLYQGLFISPHIVNESLKGAVFTAKLFERLRFRVFPAAEDYRTDIIQAVELGSPEKVIAFCRGIQKASPVDAHVIPEPWDMPGYGDQVIMAAGTFVQGASLELTADAPIRRPFIVYLQGGLSRQYVKLGVLSAAKFVLGLG
ncbi:Aluminium resistance family protein [Desulfofarcimen acetoxidans DSM 771]|uniref:Aluminium resistance family protein n=1 Tax=Desulfofarcimen acetoxidans (strain ATCC 49208 / DSM 771 / KCTC 5769 / VKM B-1644 / 5575) TaxID=485916 RepID=C8VZ51_DESAS|nr:Aluminium resistance family protein [Desulfofarcimen acetoxidans DSM 771]